MKHEGHFEYIEAPKVNPEVNLNENWMVAHDFNNGVRPLVHRKRPIAIEALKWTGKNHNAMTEFLLTSVDENIPFDIYHFDFSRGEGGLCIHTLEEDRFVMIGDVVIRGIAGEFYSCKPDIFELTYERVD
jgi:hypothetical protein